MASTQWQAHQGPTHPPPTRQPPAPTRTLEHSYQACMPPPTLDCMDSWELERCSSSAHTDCCRVKRLTGGDAPPTAPPAASPLPPVLAAAALCALRVLWSLPALMIRGGTLGAPAARGLLGGDRGGLPAGGGKAAAAAAVGAEGAGDGPSALSCELPLTSGSPEWVLRLEPSMRTLTALGA